MKHLTSILVALCAYVSLFSQTADWQWVFDAGPGDYNQGSAIATDHNGNIYVTGDFGPVPISFNSTQLTAYGGYTDVFLAKYDTLGNLLWVRTGGSAGDDKAGGVAVDAAGDIYVAGSFEDVFMYIGGDTLVGIDPSDVYIAKYNASGNLLWAKAATGANSECYALDVDAAGNIFITGIYKSGNLMVGADTLPFSNGYGAVFVARYDKNGNPLWARAAEGNQLEKGRGITADKFGNVYVTGAFLGDSIKFSNSVVVKQSPTGAAKIFVARYDTLGNVVWAKGFGKFNCEGAGISTDAQGNIFIAGTFSDDTMRFDSEILIRTGAPSSFLVMLDANGNVLWARQQNGTGHNFATSVSADNAGGICVSGYYSSGTLWVDSIALDNAGSTNSTDIFVAKYSSIGKALWAATMGGSTVEYGRGVVLYNGSAYVSGSAQSLTLYAGSLTLNPTYISTIVAKTNGSQLVGIDDVASIDFKFYPNPTSGDVFIQSSESIQQLEIFDALGRLVESKKVNDRVAQLYLKENGFYWMRVDMNGKSIVKKLVVGL